MHDLGWTSFRFEWLIDRDMAIYTVVIAGVWQASGFAMALLLAGLRSVDADLLKAAQIDGAGPVRTYLRVVFPTIGPIFVAVAGDAAAVRHQDLRPGGRADRRRAWACLHASDCRRLRLHVPARRAGARFGRGGDAARLAGLRAGALRPVSHAGGSARHRAHA